jgi:hypothetical protein
VSLLAFSLSCFCACVFGRERGRAQKQARSLSSLRLKKLLPLHDVLHRAPRPAPVRQGRPAAAAEAAALSPCMYVAESTPHVRTQVDRDLLQRTASKTFCYMAGTHLMKRLYADGTRCLFSGAAHTNKSLLANSTYTVVVVSHGTHTRHARAGALNRRRARRTDRSGW